MMSAGDTGMGVDMPGGTCSTEASDRGEKFAHYRHLDDITAFTCARRATGGVSCWGQGHEDELGNGTTSQHTTPTPVSTPGPDLRHVLQQALLGVTDWE